MSQQSHHKIEDHHWFAWLCPPPPKWGFNSKEYNRVCKLSSHQEYPKENKIHGTDAVQRCRAGFWGPKPIFFFFFFAKLMVLALKGARARHVMEMILKCFIQYHANQVLWIEVKNLDMAVPGSWSQGEQERGGGDSSERAGGQRTFSSWLEGLGSEIFHLT